MEGFRNANNEFNDILYFIDIIAVAGKEGEVCKKVSELIDKNKWEIYGDIMIHRGTYISVEVISDESLPRQIEELSKDKDSVVRYHVHRHGC